MAESYWHKVLDRRLTRRRALAATGGTAAAAALLAACGGSDSSDSGSEDTSGLLSQPTDTTKQAVRGGVLKRNLNSDVPSLDPSQNYSGSSGLYETVLGRLIGFKPGFMESGKEDQYAGDAAESWEISGDHLTITFKLRPNVKFHNLPPINGRTLDAEDVAFSWDRFARTGGQRTGVANSANPNAPVVSVTAADARTVVVKLAYPLVYAVGMFGARENVNLIPKEAADSSVLDVRNRMLSIGPYQLAESDYQRSVGFTLRRNELFYDQTVNFADQIDYPIISEYTQGAAQFRAGNLHTYGIRNEEVVALKRELPAINLFAADVASTGNRLIFGWNMPAIRDERLRQAFSLSYDRDLWVEVYNNVSAFQAEGIPMQIRYFGPFPSLSENYDGYYIDPKDEKAFGPNAKFYKHDVAEAKKLLAAAGFPNGIDVTSTFLRGTEYGADFHRQVEVRQGMNTEAGIRFENNPVDYQTEFIPKFRDSNGNFEGISYRSGPPAPSADPVAQMHYWYHSKAGASFFGFDAAGTGDRSGDPYVDDTLVKAQQEFDNAKRQALIVDLVKYLGGKMYSVQGVSGASSFAMAWPALGNYRVWFGGSANNARITNQYWWVDHTKAPNA
jgi:peptide/nickel transport system substrate-binding protein